MTLQSMYTNMHTPIPRERRVYIVDRSGYNTNMERFYTITTIA